MSRPGSPLPWVPRPVQASSVTPPRWHELPDALAAVAVKPPLDLLAHYDLLASLWDQQREVEDWPTAALLGDRLAKGETVTAQEWQQSRDRADREGVIGEAYARAFARTADVVHPLRDKIVQATRPTAAAAFRSLTALAEQVPEGATPDDLAQTGRADITGRLYAEGVPAVTTLHHVLRVRRIVWPQVTAGAHHDYLWTSDDTTTTRGLVTAARPVWRHLRPWLDAARSGAPLAVLTPSETVDTYARDLAAWEAQHRYAGSWSVSAGSFGGFEQTELVDMHRDPSTGQTTYGEGLGLNLLGQPVTETTTATTTSSDG